MKCLLVSSALSLLLGAFSLGFLTGQNHQQGNSPLIVQCGGERHVVSPDKMGEALWVEQCQSLANEKQKSVVVFQDGRVILFFMPEYVGPDMSATY